jgi:hypothetical protein
LRLPVVVPGVGDCCLFHHVEDATGEMMQTGRQLSGSLDRN